MIKTYGVHDHWTNLEKKNDVDIMSVDGVITEIKVNGEDYGGSSDFSTAEVTVNNTYGTEYILLRGGIVNTTDNRMDYSSKINDGEEAEVTVAMYKGETLIEIGADDSYNTSGNIYFDYDLDKYVVTGDCVISTEPVWWFENLTGVSAYDEGWDGYVFAITPPFELTAQQCADMVSNGVRYLTVLDGTIYGGSVFEDNGYNVKVGNSNVTIQPLTNVTHPQFNDKIIITDLPEGSHTLSIGFFGIEPLTQS